MRFFFFFHFSLSHFFQSWILHTNWNKIYPAFRCVWIKRCLACVLCLRHKHCCTAALAQLSSVRSEWLDFYSDDSCPGEKGRMLGGDMKNWLSSLQPFPVLAFAASAVIIQRQKILDAWETSQWDFYVQRNCRQPTRCMITFRWQHKLQWTNFSRSTDRTLGRWVTERKIYKQK